MTAIGKQDIAEDLVKVYGLTKARAEGIVGDVFRTIAAHVSVGGEVSIHGFGKFTRKHRQATTARNPSTGEVIDVPAKHAPHFSAAKQLKDGCNQ